ncbi:MAG TPA: transglutaminase family protein [Casimicrobiaceae bacterium]|nr:transglutaminase family protein [Casimicrobiaceae bacterium]
MAIRIALQHRTTYQFDRLVNVGPHEIRLRPAPHCRTPVASYSLAVEPARHFLNWQQDPYGNWVARLTFPERTDKLEVLVDLVAEMTVINPFDFFVDRAAETFPFDYSPALAKELAPFLETAAAGPRLAAWLEAFRATLTPGESTVDMLVRLNQRLQREIRYLVRMEAGVQELEQTLERACGSCRDSAWLLVQILRSLGLAARFASGYLIQLAADERPIDGPAGPERDFTDLHAWAEAYLPGAGWIGLDPTSGLLAGEGHLPLACTADPGNAAPVIGFTDVCEVDFRFAMHVTRFREDPRVTRPYSDAQWAAIDALGERIDADLAAHDVRLTQGGEPTFVSVDDMDGAEWNYTALGPAKRALAETLLHRLKPHFANNGLLHQGEGKWYPGEPLPRWSLSAYWRGDGEPLWSDERLFADTRSAGTRTVDDAAALARRLAQSLGLPASMVLTAYEDVPRLLAAEAALPVNADPLKANLADADERARLARLLLAGPEQPCGYVLPLKAADEHRGALARVWESSPWPLRRERLYAIAGDSPLGLRLPLQSLPDVLPEEADVEPPLDPFAPSEALPRREELRRRRAARARGAKPREVVKTALTIQVRSGHLHAFMPPLVRLDDYAALLAAVEDAVRELGATVVIEGYPPPRDARLKSLSVTPDPGVIEVNIHPASSWRELVDTTQTLYAEARGARLGTEKFMLDGRHTGTGGGNHVTLGGATPADSPLLRRPDLLRSLVTYWQNHPSLSYLFSGLFIGPTSQAPRVDEARDDRLYELEIAFQQLEREHRASEDTARPWLVDRLLRNLLTDLTGNTHRAEFSIDKLYSPDGPTGRLGLLEFRGFEMPPHPRMSAVQMLLLRALVARFWQLPYRGRLVRWGTALHDRWLLPHFVAADIAGVVAELRDFGHAFDAAWLDPFVEFRFPRYGTVAYEGVTVELRQAIEPWHVLGEEVSRGGTARFVDSSVERLQVRVDGATPGRHAISCNGRALPLAPTGVPGEYVAGVRFRAWSPPSALHPTIGVQAPLTFDVVDKWSGRSLGGCTYHVAHPGGRNYETFPVNANEAEARRVARFWAQGHTPGPMQLAVEPPNPAMPTTLDLRWQPGAL